jgi:hypothetical protein
MSSVDHFDDKNIITCVGSSIPEAFFNNESILELSSFKTSHFLNQPINLAVVANGSLHVPQDMVGDIHLGGFRREVTVWQ